MSKKAVKNNGKFGDALILTIFMVVSQSLVLGQDRNPNPLIYSFLDIYGILVSHEYIKATYGNAGAPLKHPYCESRPMLILIILSQGGWHKGGVQAPGSSLCGDSGLFPCACGLLDVELRWRWDTCQHMLGVTILLSPSPPPALPSLRRHPILEQLWY